MINLTEEYLQQNKDIWNKLKHSLKLDMFYADSLEEIPAYFKLNPPKNREGGYKSAFVLVDNVKIKRIPATAEDFKYLDKEFKVDYVTKIFTKLFKPKYKELLNETGSEILIDLHGLERLAMIELNRKKFYPTFLIKDKSDERIASWWIGNSKVYKEFEKDFRFNTENYVNIPVVLLIYEHDDENGGFRLMGLNKDNKSHFFELANKVRLL